LQSSNQRRKSYRLDEPLVSQRHWKTADHIAGRVSISHQSGFPHRGGTFRGTRVPRPGPDFVARIEVGRRSSVVSGAKVRRDWYPPLPKPALVASSIRDWHRHVLFFFWLASVPPLHPHISVSAGPSTPTRFLDLQGCTHNATI